MQDLVQFRIDLDESVKLAPTLGGPEMVTVWRLKWIHRPCLRLLAPP
jgi:hypothetical protein